MQSAPADQCKPSDVLLSPSLAVKPISSLQADVGALRHRLGRQLTPARGRPDISAAGLDNVSAEGARLREECARRAAERDALMAALKRACVDLGEDAAALAAEVHPALHGRYGVLISTCIVL